MHISFQPQISPISKYNSSGIGFKSNNINSDTFETKSEKINGFWLTNPYDGRIYETDRSIDLKKPQHFVWEKKSIFPWLKPKYFTVEFNPKKTGTLIDKKTKEPIEVFILKSNDEKENDIDHFHFLSKDLRTEYGNVCFTKDYKSCSDKIASDYEEEGIVGDRIVVLWLENKKSQKVGGVGKLADKLAVQYCLENGLEPNIISVSCTDSMLAHYKRGKRFIPPREETRLYQFLKDTYGTTNPNEVFENMLSESKHTAKHIDLEPFSDYEGLVMYLPRELAESYK